MSHSSCNVKRVNIKRVQKIIVHLKNDRRLELLRNSWKKEKTSELIFKTLLSTVSSSILSKILKTVQTTPPSLPESRRFCHKFALKKRKIFFLQLNPSSKTAVSHFYYFYGVSSFLQVLSLGDLPSVRIVSTLTVSVSVGWFTFDSEIER